MNLQTAWIFFIAIYLSGCTTLAPVERFSDRLESSIATGDRVSLSTKAGVREFAVTRVSAGEICGNEQCFGVGEITALEKREFSAWQSGLLAVVIVAAVLGVVAASRVAIYPGGL